MAKKKLGLVYDYDFIMYGISCYNRDYMLVHAINNKLDIDLKKLDDLVFFDQKNKESSEFTMFTFENKDNIHYIVVGNKSTRTVLIPEMDKYDYFLVIKNTNKDFDAKSLLQELKTLKIIVLINEIDPSKLKSKQNLIIDL